MGKAKGLVSGAAHTTADTVRPALQVIKTKQGYKRCSGAFIMLRGEEMYLMADCAINIDLDFKRFRLLKGKWICIFP